MIPAPNFSAPHSASCRLNRARRSYRCSTAGSTVVRRCDVVTGMKRQGYEVSVGDHGGQWIAVFFGGAAAMRPSTLPALLKRRPPGRHCSARRGRRSTESEPRWLRRWIPMR